MLKTLRLAFLEYKFWQMSEQEVEREFCQLLIIGLALADIGDYTFAEKAGFNPNQIEKWKLNHPEAPTCKQVLILLQGCIFERFDLTSWIRLEKHSKG